MQNLASVPTRTRLPKFTLDEGIPKVRCTRHNDTEIVRFFSAMTAEAVPPPKKQIAALRAELDAARAHVTAEAKVK